MATMATPSLTWSDVTRRRMARSFLTTPLTDGGPAEVAAALCGVHAQIQTAAELSVGRRIVRATRADVHGALWEQRSLVKTFGPRGTVHLVATADLPMWTGALSALPSSVPRHPDGVRFTGEEAEQVIAAIDEALLAGPLTVDELTAAVETRTGHWAVEQRMDAFQVKWPRWRQLTSTAAHRGVLCFGPTRGRNVTYANPSQWLRGVRPDPGGEALATLVLRYLTAYGPATPQHLAKWLAIPPRVAADLFDRLGGRIEQVDFEGEPTWTVTGDTAVVAEAAPSVRLLPYFDAFVVAGQPRERLFPGVAATRALAGGQAGNYPVLLLDGIVGGVWHQRRSGRRIEITVEPFGRLTSTQRRELDDEAQLVGAVMEATPTLRLGPVRVGPHA